MKIKQAVIYRLKDVRKSILLFYLIVFASYLLINILANLESVHVSGMSGLEMSSMIFLLVIGLNSFKPTFYLFVQNGVSRKTMYHSYLISMLISSAIMAFIDAVVFTLIGPKLGIISLFEQLYTGFYEDQLLIRLMVTFLWCLTAYFAFCNIGYFITVLYYRMNKALKLIISISVPCTLFIGVPILDSYFNGKITRMFVETFDFFFGTGADRNPFASVISCCCISLVLVLLSFGFVKKVVVKRI